MYNVEITFPTVYLEAPAEQAEAEARASDEAHRRPRPSASEASAALPEASARVVASARD